MKFLIITNRRLLDETVADQTVFGEEVNIKGASELRFAWAKKRKKKWNIQLIKEPSRIDPRNTPGEKAINRYLFNLKKEARHCVYYVHGFNKTFEDSLNQAHQLTKRYGTGVILFSWPSNPGGFFVSEEEYRTAKAIASNSIVALDRTFAKLCSCINQNTNILSEISVNLLIHSLGNYMFEQFVKNPIFTRETRAFNNIILNAPDIDHKLHEEWTDGLVFARRVYVTINEEDSILSLSEYINPDRLGNTARNLISYRLTYFDLSDGKKVRRKHQHFESTARKNNVVAEFFKRALHGKQSLPISGVKFENMKNAYELIDKEPEVWHGER